MEIYTLICCFHFPMQELLVRWNDCGFIIACVLVRVLHRNRTNRRYTHTHTHIPIPIHIQRERERCILRSWLTQLWGPASLKCAGQACRLETQGRADIATQVLRQSGVRILSSRDLCLFFYLRPLTDWMRPTHIMEASLLYSKSTNLNINHI